MVVTNACAPDPRALRHARGCNRLDTRLRCTHLTEKNNIR